MCKITNKIPEVVAVLKNINGHPMAAKNKKKVFARFFIWNLIESPFLILFNKGGILKKWFDDRKLFVCPGRTVSTANYYLGLFEYPEMAFLLHYARNSDVFVDCGANIGIYSILLRKICKKGYAIEPSTKTQQILQKNMKANNMTNIKTVQMGVSNEMGTLYFTKGYDAENHIVKHPLKSNLKNYEKIHVDTLDSICSIDKHNINILKIDVAGNEENVLSGANNILNSPALNVVIMEIFRTEKLVNLLTDKGFKLFTYNPQTRQLCPSAYGDVIENGDNGIFIQDINSA